MNRREFAAAVAAASLFPALTQAAGKPKATIAVSVLTLANPFFKDLADAIAAEAKARGMDTLVTSGEFDVARQLNQVADFIVRKVDAIVLCPCDSKAIGTAIAQANRAGIPVFTADIASLAPGAKVVGHVAEGVVTAESAYHLAERLGVDLPICGEVYRVLFEQKPVSDAIRAVLGGGLDQHKP